MKKLTFMLSLLLFAGAAMAQPTSARHENTPPTQMVDPVFNLNRSGSDCNFLVFMDNLPWQSAAIQAILTANGESFVVMNSSDMATVDFSPYDVIIIASDQARSFHYIFDDNIPKFARWVRRGGILQAHVAVCGWFSPCGYSVVLPGGVSATIQYDPYNVIVNAGHPIVAGVSNPFHGDYASHGIFSNLLPGTDIITAAQSNGLPTTIQYNFGSGTVIATTCTYEYGYEHGLEAGEMLVNNINYSCTIEPLVVLPVSNWALYIGILLILTFVVIRFRRMI